MIKNKYFGYDCSHGYQTIADICHKGGVVVFDLDGVLCEYKYAEKACNGLFPCKDTDAEITKLFSERDIYALYARPLKTLQRLMEHIPSSKVYVMSKSRPCQDEQKLRFLATHYPNINPSQVHFVREYEEKVTLLKALAEKFPIVGFVEDVPENIIMAEDNISNLVGIHISAFID